MGRAAKVYRHWLTTNQDYNPDVDVIGVNTTADGKQFFWGIGDSNGDGRGETIPVVAANTLFIWIGSVFVEVTNQTIANQGGAYGSCYQQFATDHKTNTTHVSYVLNSSKGGATAWPDSALAEHWMGAAGPTGVDLYAPAKVEALQGLAVLGLTKPKGIFVNLLVNDMVANTTEANATTAVNAIIANLTTDFPGVPILWVAPGRSGTANATTTTNNYSHRKLLLAACDANTNVHICGSAPSLIGANRYNADNIHYIQTGYDYIGACYARWFKNSAYGKWPRSIMSSLYDDVSSARKSVIDYVVGRQHANGNYFKMDMWFVAMTTTENNFYVDWTFLGDTFKTSTPTFTANDCISMASSTTAFYSYVSWGNTLMRGASQNDFFEGWKITARSTSGAAVLFGVNNGTVAISVGQTTAPLTNHRANDNTLTSGPGHLLAINTFHATARSGANTKILLENDTVTATNSVASLSPVNQISRLGCYNNNGTAATPITASFRWGVKGIYTTFGLTSLMADMAYYETNW